MSRFHYFSKSELCFKEIKLSHLSFAVFSLIVFTSLVAATFAYFSFDPLGIAKLHSSNIARDNSILRAHLASLNTKLNNLDASMNNLAKSDDQLRTSVNLPSIPRDMRKVAVGGTKMNTDFGASSSVNKSISSAITLLDLLNRKAELQQQSYANILKKYKANQELFSRIPAIDPIRDGSETDGFGMRMHPILHVRIMHEGLDIAANVGTPVHATGDGIVSYVGRRGGYGNVVEINHGFGYSTLYGHLSKPLVKSGQRVSRGQNIALSGNTGLSTGPHLHYEVRKNGAHVDPSEYYFEGDDSFALYTNSSHR
jgi:murein DD-endopeptidase MepM/ murein hydrolase activator NlpD